MWKPGTAAPPPSSRSPPRSPPHSTPRSEVSAAPEHGRTNKSGSTRRNTNGPSSSSSAGKGLKSGGGGGQKKKGLSTATMGMRFMKRKAEASEAERREREAEARARAERERMEWDATTTGGEGGGNGNDGGGGEAMSEDEGRGGMMVVPLTATAADVYGVGAEIVGRRSYGDFNKAVQSTWKEALELRTGDNRSAGSNRAERQQITDEELLQRYEKYVKGRGDMVEGGGGRSAAPIGNLAEKVQKRKRKR